MNFTLINFFLLLIPIYQNIDLAFQYVVKVISPISLVKEHRMLLQEFVLKFVEKLEHVFCRNRLSQFFEKFDVYEIVVQDLNII